jgi:hypothetical protein
MTDAHLGSNVARPAKRRTPAGRRIKRGAAIQKANAPAKSEKFTTFEIATYDGGHKEFSVIARITTETGLKLLALANRETKA